MRLRRRRKVKNISTKGYDLNDKYWSILSALVSKRGTLKAKQIQYYINNGTYGLNRGEASDGRKVIKYLGKLKEFGLVKNEERCRGNNWFLSEKGKEFIRNWINKMPLGENGKKIALEVLLVLMERKKKILIGELRNILKSRRGTGSKEPLYSTMSDDSLHNILIHLQNEDLIELKETGINDLKVKVTWKGKTISLGEKYEI